MQEQNFDQKEHERPLVSVVLTHEEWLAREEQQLQERWANTWEKLRQKRYEEELARQWEQDSESKKQYEIVQAAWDELTRSREKEQPEQENQHSADLEVRAHKKNEEQDKQK